MERASRVVRWSRVGFVVTAWLFAACIAVQVFLAGLSTFGSPARWDDHVSFGRMIGTLTILLVVFALVGRLPRPVIGMAVGVLVLYVLQMAFANIDESWVAALHAVNALTLFWVTTHVAQRTQQLAFPATAR